MDATVNNSRESSAEPRKAPGGPVRPFWRAALPALLLCLGVSELGAVATITVDATDGDISDDGLCSINEAIINANDDAATEMDCAAGFGADTLLLTVDVTLFDRFPTVIGQTATRSIQSTIIIDGQGHTLRRDPSTVCITDGSQGGAETRLLHVAAGANLAVRNVTLAGGCADGAALGLTSRGGAILNEGSLSVHNSTLSGNQARQHGGAIANFGTISMISNSTLSGNSCGSSGGGIYNLGTIFTISNSTFSVNTATLGGGMANFGSIFTISNCTFSEGSADDGSGIFSAFNDIVNLTNTVFANSLSGNDCEFLNESGSNNLSDGTCQGNIGPVTGFDSLLKDNGCAVPTAGSCVKTHALLPGSNAIDTAVNGTPKDQRGFGAAGVRDIGAFEFNGQVLIFADGFE